MTLFERVPLDSYAFSVDLIHLTFLTGLLVSYFYYRRRQISVGGSLAVGYLAATVQNPWNIVFTVAVSFVAFLVIKYVVLRIWLPRPRQIFAIGLFVGIVAGSIWMAIDNIFFRGFTSAVELALIGVIVPGMLSNSFIKQGVAKTIIPLVWMLPLTIVLGFLVTWLSSNVLPLSFSGALYQDLDPSANLAFGVFAISIVVALVVQDGLLAKYNFRTGGYIAGGFIVSLFFTPVYLVVFVVATALVYGVYTFVLRNAPLYGKDRFVVLCLFSFFFVICLQAAAVALTGQRVGGAENIVFCVLPAVLANDLIQYGVRRTAPGLTLSIAACAVLGVPGYLLTA